MMSAAVVSSRSVFLTFGGGTDEFRNAAQRIGRQAREMCVFDEVLVHTDRTLQSDYPLEFEIQQHFMHTHPRGLGYWWWKPFLAMQVLYNLRPGDLLCYLDAGCELNPVARMRMLHYMALARHCGSCFFATGWPEWKFQKADLLAAFRLTGNTEFLYSRQIEANSWMIVKSDITTQLCRQWYRYHCSDNHHLATDAPSRSVPSECPGFCEHRHDQSILSILVKRHHMHIVGDDNRSAADCPILTLRNRTGNSRLADHIRSVPREPPRAATDIVWHRYIASTSMRIGLGDFLRGCVYLQQQFCNDRVKLFIDFSQHPIGRWIQPLDEQVKSIVFNREDVTVNQPAASAAVREFPYYVSQQDPNGVRECIRTNQALLTNHFPSMPVDISHEMKSHIRLFLQPGRELRSAIDQRMQTYMLQPRSYAILSIRMGDQFLVTPSQRTPGEGVYASPITFSVEDMVVLDEIARLLHSSRMPVDKPIVLMSDCGADKLNIVQAHLFHWQQQQQGAGRRFFNLHACSSSKVVHLAFADTAHNNNNNNDAQQVRDTLIDFFIMANADFVLQLSSYSWCSGFAQWAATLHNVDIEFHQITPPSGEQK
jgi:hypothetical protein